MSEKPALQSRVDVLFDSCVQKLTDEQRAHMLSFLVGYCGKDKSFVQGMESFLANTHPELYEAAA